MIKTCYILIFVCCTYVCGAQTSNSYYGVVLTKITYNGKEKDTSKFLYCRNMAADRLSVYTVKDGVVSEAIGYHLKASKNGSYLYSRPLPGEQVTDSLRVDFQDDKNTVLVNSTDRYELFPSYYARFKHEVKAKHSIMSVLTLLSDAPGDYPISSVSPLLNSKPQFDKKIIKATVVTQRSHADMKDTWMCNYYYSKNNKLDSVIVKSPDETRFYKKVHYDALKPTYIITYLNIEDRQVTQTIIHYDNSNHNLLKWQERINELSKNRETKLSVTLIYHNLGQLRKLEPTNTEVIQLLKLKKTYDYSKKHID